MNNTQVAKINKMVSKLVKSICIVFGVNPDRVHVDIYIHKSEENDNRHLAAMLVENGYQIKVTNKMTAVEGGCVTVFCGRKENQ